jgi:lipopolysaccharide export LptBFGC system permease protein LptF
MGLRLTFGIFAGLGFKYLQDLFAPAALVFNIPALIAILMPIALYWTVAWILIRRNA